LVGLPAFEPATT